MISHQGEIVEKVVRSSGKKITVIAKELGMSRENLYDIFKRPEVPIAILIQLGKIVNHDFTQNFPEYFNILNEDQSEYSLLPERLKRIEKELEMFKEKCMILMEQNNLLMTNKLELYFTKFGTMKN